MASCAPWRFPKGAQCIALCIHLCLAVPARCRPATAAVYPERGRTALTTRAPSSFAGRRVPLPALPVRASGRARNAAAAPSNSKLASAALGSPRPLAASRSEGAPSTTPAQHPGAGMRQGLGRAPSVAHYDPRAFPCYRPQQLRSGCRSRVFRIGKVTASAVTHAPVRPSGASPIALVRMRHGFQADETANIVIEFADGRPLS